MASDLAAELQAFAKANYQGGGRACLTCSLPPKLRKLIEEQRQKHGTSFRVLSAWLRSKKHQISTRAVQNHFASHLE